MLKARFADSFSRGKKQTRKRKALAFGQDLGLRFGVLGVGQRDGYVKTLAYAGLVAGPKRFLF
jgi:hypothetical protein